MSLVVLGSQFPLDHLVAYGVFTNWTSLRFEFGTHLSHHVWYLQKQWECMEAWDFNGNKVEVKSLRVNRKRKCIWKFSPEKRKWIVKHIVYSWQYSARWKNSFWLNGKTSVSESLLLYQFKRWLWIVWELTEMARNVVVHLFCCDLWIVL